MVAGRGVWFFGFGVSAIFANWSMIFINYIQHVHADPWSEHNHSRNFVRKLGNWFVFNNGYHTAHHESAGLHWSKLPEAHAKIAHLIDPELNAGEHRRRTACGRTCWASSATGTGRTRWARGVRSAGRRRAEAGDGVGRGGRGGRQRVDGVSGLRPFPRGLLSREAAGGGGESRAPSEMVGAPWAFRVPRTPYRRGRARAGIVASYAYAAMNLLVLGHYLVAPPWRLPPLINLFIVVEAAAAMLLLVYTVRLQVDELVTRARSLFPTPAQTAARAPC